MGHYSHKIRLVIISTILMTLGCAWVACAEGNHADAARVVTFAFNEVTGLTSLVIDSPIGISAVQVKFDIPEDVALDEVKLSGFMTGAEHKSQGEEHRWYNLSANGEKTASLTIDIESSKDSNQVITLFDVDLKDTEGKLISVSDKLPLMVQIGSVETATTKSSEKGPTEKTRQSRIAFISNRAGADNIYVMNADGSKQTRITNNSDTYVVIHDLSWAPDGNRIAFVQGDDRTRTEEIYVMNPDGSNRIQLTRNRGPYWSPAWSPDGKKIAFVSDGGDIYIMNADGSNTTLLTMHGLNPTWLPDGARIAFERDGDVYIMDVDGGSSVRLTDNLGQAGSPSWSPDGKKIAFVSDRDGKAAIYVMNVDGTNQLRLTWNPLEGRYEDDNGPTWSPDSAKIAFYRSFITGDRRHLEICVVNADGGSVTQLTNCPGVVFGGVSPAWSPR